MEFGTSWTNCHHLLPLILVSGDGADVHLSTGSPGRAIGHPTRTTTASILPPVPARSEVQRTRRCATESSLSSSARCSSL